MLARVLSAVLVVTFLTAAVWHHTAAKSASSEPYLVVIVMDGFRPDYETLAHMRHLHWLMARGMTYDNAWVGQMESETPTGHATIATGVYPRKHGVTGFGWRDPQTNNFTYMPTDLRQINSGALARTIENGGVPTISDLVHARNPRDIVVSTSGEKYYASATMGTGANYILFGSDTDGKFRPTTVGPNVPPASTHYTSITEPDGAFDTQDHFSASLAARLAETLHPRALLVNLPATDIAGHYYGGMRDPADMTSIIQGADAGIAIILDAYRKMGILNRTVFVVTADHGMASNRHIVPVHAMYKVAAHTGASILDEEYRISVGSIWLRDPAAAPGLAATMAAQHFTAVEGALYKVNGPNGMHFEPAPQTKAALPKALVRAYLDLADTEASTNGPDVIMPYVEDGLGLTVKGSKSWGSHGGFSWGVQHIPLVIAGPGVRHGVSHFPAKLVDVAPTAEQLAGLTVPNGVDGVVLADALQKPSAAQRSAQAAVQARRMADVNALRAHSIAQSKQSK